MDLELINKKLRAIKIINTEYSRRIKYGKTKTINIEINIANGSMEGLKTIAKDYEKDFSKMERINRSLNKLLNDIQELIQNDKKSINMFFIRRCA